jgi:Protein of unknown function (DUF1761)
LSFDSLGDLNWLAVIVGALIYFALGALWYSPVFLGKPWQRATGLEQADMEGGPGPAIYVAPLLGYLISAIATGMIAKATGASTFGDGIVLGLVVGIGYSTVITAITAVFSPKLPAPFTWFWITASYNLVGLLIVGVLVSVWD